MRPTAAAVTRALLALLAALSGGACSLIVGIDEVTAAPVDAASGDAAPSCPGATCPTDMALVPTMCMCIDQFEASKKAGSPTIAASVTGATPWAMIDWTSAESACEAAGKRLCSGREWEAACAGPAPGRAYPYGNTFSGSACNGYDHGAGAAVATGSITTCEGGFSTIFDMSGNVWEWTSDCSGTMCSLRGGSFTLGDDLRCASSASSGNTTNEPTMGFRCCREIL